MPREKEDFRDNLERVIARFGDRDLIPVREVSKAYGVAFETITHNRDLKSSIRRVGRQYQIPTVALARWLS